MSAPAFVHELSAAAWREHFLSRGVPAYRAGQALDWVFHKFAASPDAMTNFPAALRESLRADFVWDPVKVVETLCSPDGTEKLLLELHDGERIEMVIIPSRERRSVCLSTQVGCPVRCAFCASGRDGLKRNLEAAEIVGQFAAACRRLNGHPDNVVFMGVGEPLLNFNNLARALEMLNDEALFNFAARRVTISTSGIPERIRRLGALERQWNLAVSLHAPDDATRSKLIPDQCRHPIAEILEACEEYRSLAGRMVTLEYALIKGVNDREDQAAALAVIAKKLRAKVNLIPYNPTAALGFERPSDHVCRAFAAVLERRGARVTMRVEKGGGVAAACGQLRASRAVAEQ